MDEALTQVPVDVEDAPIVPGEFVINEDIGVPAPEPAPQRLITKMNPSGSVQGEKGADFGISVRGGFRQNTILGASEEAQGLAISRGEIQSPNRLREAIRAIGSDVAPYPDLKAEQQAKKEQLAEDRLIEQLAYENAGSFQSAAGVAGTFLGSIASPETFGGLEGLLVRKFPMLVGRPIVTQAIDAAITNTLTDPFVQGARMKSGAQENYDPLQTALAPAVGAVAGGALGVAGRGVSKVLGGSDARVSPDLTPAERTAGVQPGPEAVSPDAAQAPARPQTIDDVVNAPEPVAAPNAEGVVGTATGKLETPLTAKVAEPVPVEPVRVADVAAPVRQADVTPREVAPLPEPAARTVVSEPKLIGEAVPNIEPQQGSVTPAPKLLEGGSTLSETASWVIRDRATKDVVMETFDPKKVDALNTEKYEAVPIQQYLGEVNRNIKAGVAEATPEILARRGGAATKQQHIANQMDRGRPLTDQGTLPLPDAKVFRIEEISKQLVESFKAIARTGRVTPGAQGTYKTRFGVVRVRSVSDFDTLAHEVGHSLHIGGGAKSDFDRIISANIRELQAFGAGQGPEGNAEAFANLFHAYVTNLPFAERSYPNAAAALDELLRVKFLKEYADLQEIRSVLDTLHRAPSVDVVSADTITSQPPNFGDKFKELAGRDMDPQGRVVYSAFDALYTGSVDSNHPIYKAVQNLVDIAKDNGKAIDLKPMDDAYILARRLPGSHGSADTMLKHGVIPVGSPRPEGPSLSSGIEKALGKKWDSKGFEDFGAYLAARRMVAEYKRFFAGELDRAPGKLSFADYQKAVADFEAATPAFRAGAEDIYTFQKNALKRDFDKHLLTREQYEVLVAREDYVPLMRDQRNFEDGPAPTSRTGTDSKGLLSKSILKRFRGSDRPVINPLESIFKKRHDIEFVIARNDANRALRRLALEAGPGAGYIYEDIPSNQLKGQKVDVIEALRAAGHTAGIDDADLTHLLIQAEDLLGDSTWATIFRQEPIQEGKEPIIYIWENGERRAGRLGDARLGQEMHHALTSMSDYEKDIFTTVLSMTSTILRTAITKSPDFILVNAIRDQFSSALTAGRKYVPFVSMAKGLAEAITKSDDAVQFAGQGGLAGGGIVEAMSSSKFGRNVKSLQGHNWLGEVLKAFELSETGTRVGLYKSYLEQAKIMGLDPENAALYAVHKADDYIDFRKHGAALGVPRRIFTFLNAFIQGTDRESRAIFDYPVLAAKQARGEVLTSLEKDRYKDSLVALLRLTTAGIVLGGGLAVLNQNNERYQNAPKYTKNTNFLFSLNGMDFAIPKGFGFSQSVVNLFERGTEFAMRRDPTLATDWLEGMASAFTAPMGNTGLTLAYDIPANYDRFRDQPIVPYYMQGMDKTQQAGTYTSALARQVAKGADAIGLKISPMKIDFALQALGGGGARDVLFAWDSIMGNDRPEKQIYDYPVARRFVKNLERGSQATTAFYKLVGEKTGDYETAENAYRGKINNGERADAADYLKNLKEDSRAWVTLNALGFDANEKRLHPMYNARERVSIINGMVRQLTNGNVIKESDLDRTNLTMSRRDAEPIKLDPHQRAKLSEELLSLSVATARNAMVTVGAKGTTGLGLMDTAPIENAIRLISPDVADEFAARMSKKNLPTLEQSAQVWPEMKRRLLVDGENAELTDLIPPEVRRKAKRRGR